MRVHDIPACALARLGRLSALLVVVSAPSWAQTAAEPRPVIGDRAAAESDMDLAKQLQNPVGDLISFPIQTNLNFGHGPHRGTQDVVNLQPVIPFHINEDWNIITRTILPMVWNPSLSPLPTVPAGTAPASFTAFLSLTHDINGWLWGAGPVVQVPTITSATLGSNVWGAGPSAVAVWSAARGSPACWSTTSGRSAARPELRAPATAAFSPIPSRPRSSTTGGILVLAEHYRQLAVSRDKWTVPVGGGFGRIFRIGVFPVDLSISTYYNIVKLIIGGRWQLSTTLTFVF